MFVPLKNNHGYFIILAFSLLFQGLISCKKDNTVSANAPSPVSQPFVSTANLLSNSNFNLWDTSNNFFKDWKIDLPLQGVVTRDSGGIKFSGDVLGSYYIYQRIKVDNKKFYKASITASYTVNNYFAGGIYVMDTGLHKILGKFERSYSSGADESWDIVFYNKKETEVAVVIGFFEGINANVVFSNASLTEYKYTPRMSGSYFSAYLGNKFPLVFNARQYDSTINRISDYVNSVLLCRYAYFSDTAELPILDQMIGNNPDYAYLNQYLHDLDEIRVGYCQKSSLSLGEILTNEFNIPVRQLHMVFGTEGKHQFQEYWNPFSRRWIIIDPCFNTRYIKNDRLLGDEDFDKSEAPALMVRFGSHYFYDNLDELVDLWQGMDELQVSDYYTITFPFY
jgi:hypothetical protein